MPLAWESSKLGSDQGLHQNKIASVLLSSRNIQDLDVFLSPSFKGMSDPSSISGCDKTAEMFASAISNKWKVAVIGDYDVDGVVSASMLKMFFNAFKTECYVFLPHRIDHGYGLNAKTIKAFLTQCPFVPDLVIASDCGTSSEKEIVQLKEAGIKAVAVIDHHKPNDGMFSNSADVVMNWRLSSGAQETCTAGQIFHLARRFSNGYLNGKKMPKELSAFLPMAAVAIVADVMPISGDNRIVVRKGLERIRSSPVGMVALAEKCGMTAEGSISQKDVAFRMAPRINAAGRIGSPVDAFDLVMEDDPIAASAHVESLTAWNKERRGMQKDIEKQAIEQARASGFKNGIMVYSQDWHVGVVGIVASKVVEEFGVPAIVIGETEGKRKGSARSVQGVNVKAVMDSCSKVFEAYGGHEMAAGCTLNKDFYETAAFEFDAACAAWYKEHGRPESTRYYDMDLDILDLNVSTAEALKETLYPYCSVLNPEPIFRMSSVLITRFDQKSGDGWVRTSFRCNKDGRESGLRFVTFDANIDESIEGKKADIYFSFGQNTTGDWPPDLEVVDIIEK
jgi:single-stranded-DNA-specific exonuclease